MAANQISSGIPALANRAYALDALRGLAILAMLLSGQEPFGHNALPAWMYHGQEPPPHHDWLGTLPGITWVDLVFPTFLFCMGAAFPLALSRRLDQGVSKARVGLFILGRGFLLGFFALYVMAIRPGVLSNQSDQGVLWLGLLGFFLLFPVLTRLPETWSSMVKWLVRGIGWVGVSLFLALAHYPDETHPGFWLGRSDIIIVVLTNMAVFGSLIWMCTRHNLLLRLGVLGIVFALRMSNLPLPDGSWVTDLWKFSPAPWIYQCYYLQYLCIVIPGTIAGDLILRWTRGGPRLASSLPEPAAAAGAEPPALPRSLDRLEACPTLKAWSAGRYLAIAGLVAALVVVALTGLESRVPASLTTVRQSVFMLNGGLYMRPWVVPATLLSFALCAVGGWLLREPGNATERLHQQVFRWGAYWLVLGLIFEPYEGGIKKDHPTMSYYFVTSGLASFLFIGFSVVIDRFKRRHWVRLLIDNGQNPMIAYAGINNFIIPVLVLTGGMAALAPLETSPWLGFLRGLIIILLMAVVVSILSRRKVFWRT